MANDQLFSFDGSHSDGLRFAELCQTLIIESGVAGLKRGDLLFMKRFLIRDMHQLIRLVGPVSSEILLFFLLRGSCLVLNCLPVIDPSNLLPFFRRLKPK